MIPMIYIIMLVAWLLLIFGFHIEDVWIVVFASLLLMPLGVYITGYGITGVNNLSTTALGYIHIGVGAYVVIRGTYEYYKDKF